MPARVHKAWSGRFVSRTHPLVEEFTTSLPVDRRLYAYDIAGSKAHCRMLAKQRIISRSAAQRIVRALEQIRAEIDGGSFRWMPGDEDIHMAVERRLIEKIGPTGGQLHTARSRNDQVALDTRLYLRDQIDALAAGVRALQKSLAKLARRHRKAIMPGYTHLQPAQPVLFAHHLLAYVEMLERDRGRLRDCRVRADVMPLGSGALAGTTFPIDPQFVARQLGFQKVSENSMDAVGSRDVLAEFAAAGAILGVNLSRLGEEIVLWSTQEFGFIGLPDAFATGSSMMPQKKNPDVAELVRGKSGRLVGNLVALLTMQKGLPLAYNRDLQEDKAALFDTVDTLRGALAVLAAMIPELAVHEKRMREAADKGFTLATELADYLATRGIPFRQAHEVVGGIVRHCLESKRTLSDLTLADLRRFSPRFAEGVFAWLTPDAAVARRRAVGGTAPANVVRRLRELRL
jgi:argininosuccinate lyase